MSRIHHKFISNVRHQRRLEIKIIVFICSVSVLQVLHFVVAKEDVLNASSSYVPTLITTAEEILTGTSSADKPSEQSISFSHHNQVEEQRNFVLSSSSHSTSSTPEYIASSIDGHKSQMNADKNSTMDIFLAVGINSKQTKHKLSNYSHSSVMSLVRGIDAQLRSIRNVELGITTIQEMFDAMEFADIQNEPNETLLKFTKNLSLKLKIATTDMNNLKRLFETNITQLIEKEIANTDDNHNQSSSPAHTQFNNRSIFLNTSIQPCPFEDFSLEQNYNKHQIRILNYLKTNIDNNLATENCNNNLSFKLNRQILEEVRRLHSTANNYKNVYFLSNYDYATDHNCQYYFNNLNFRRLYASTIMPKKSLFILIDIGSAMTVEQLELSKAFVSNLVQMLSETDFITIVTVSDEAIPLELNNFQLNVNNNNYEATDDNKEKILDIISVLKRSNEQTNHTLGFEYSFRLLSFHNLSEEQPFELIYVTRGLLTQLSDAKNVLSAIADGQQKLAFPVVINTCGIILDEKRIMYEKQFLTDITYQNYTKYDINISNWKSVHLHQQHNLVGNLYVITKRHPERIVKISTQVYYDLFHRYKQTTSSSKFHLHHSFVDADTKDAIVPITLSLPNFGAIGVNLYLTDLAEDVMSFKNTDNCYIFMIDVKGITIIHPALQQVPYLTKTPLPVDIALLENSMNFRKLRHFRKQLLTLNEGNVTVAIRESIAAAAATKQNTKETVSKTYSWYRVMDMFVICIVTIASRKISNGKTSVPQYQSRYVNVGWQKSQHREYIVPIDLLYHRIDLVSPPRTPACRYFRQIATTDSGTLFLSSSCFKSPFTYIKNNRINCDLTKIRIVQSIMAFLKDNTGLLVNPGLLPRIRNDVNVLYSVMEHLKKRHLQNDEFKNYIIRRYAATISGVLQIYPGCLLPADFEPSTRPWFLKAMQHPGKIVITEPYLDSGGAGYIITIAHTIFEGKANALHNPARDSAVAIIALDVPYGFLYKLILDTPLCQENNIKCILFENEGYLIAHPSMMEPVTDKKNVRRPHEHLTHKESFLANDILNHKMLVTKLACANYENRTVQRYYKFNTSLTEVLTNVVHGERIKYKITSVFGTNIFAAVLNSTCDGGAFCPCSTVDRICLNCNRMDQTDCECPCECPMQMKSPIVDDNGDNVNETEEYEFFLNYALRYPYCGPTPLSDIDRNNHWATESNINSPSLAKTSFEWNMVLNSCIHINCDVYVTHLDCLAVMGCEWCQLDLDGNPFSAPFCTMQHSCFNGVLNSITPYGDGELGSAIIEPPGRSQPYSAIGPVGGAIIVLCLILGFAMYCYRQSLDNGVDQFYVDSLHDDNYGVPLSRFNFDNIPPHDNGDMDDLGGGGHRGVLDSNLVHPIGNAIMVPDISPYHMSTGSSYRRPPNGESDHGYSTMTPHEDSEHMCFTLAEPLINSNKRLSKSDSLSITTSVSSPTNHYHNYNKSVVAVDRPVSSMGTRIRSSNDQQICNTPKNNSVHGQTDLSSCIRESENQQSQQQKINSHHILAQVTVHRHMEAL